MTAKKNELFRLLELSSNIERRVKKIQISPSENWEARLKADIVRTNSYTQAYLADYIRSLEMETVAMNHLIQTKAIQYAETLKE